MDRNEELQLLKELLNQIEQYTEAAIELNEAKNQLKTIQMKSLSAVTDFDAIKKIAFIESKIGVEPEKPKGAIKLAVPLYLSKKKVYEKEYAEYLTRFKEAEKEYYAEFKDTREKIESEEKSELAFSIQLAEAAVTKATDLYQMSVSTLNENDTVSTKFKDATIIKTLIEYFQDRRVDSIKEAVNLYYEEEHRKRLEEFAEKQVSLTAEAAESARLAAISAEEAADSAEEAMRIADEALRKAEDAYNLADDE